MTKDKALDLALEALEESVDLVREDYENAKKLYSNYPSRQARLIGLEDGLSKHEAAITAIKQARSAPVQEPVADGLIRQYITALVANKPDEAANATKGMVDYVYTAPPAAQRQWVGLTDEEIYKIDCLLITNITELVMAIEAKLRSKNGY
jgi:hypothetical protein